MRKVGEQVDVPDVLAQHGYQRPTDVTDSFNWRLAWSPDQPVYRLEVPRRRLRATGHDLRKLLSSAGYWPVIGWGEFTLTPWEIPQPPEIIAAGLRVDIADWLRTAGLERAIEPRREESFSNYTFPSSEFQHSMFRSEGQVEMDNAVSVALLPIDAPWKAPAYLCLTGDDPSPEAHIALMHDWYQRWGAELVAASPNELEMQVLRPPADYGQAQTLAKQQYAYCPDLVLQNTGSIRELTNHLLGGHRWWFWWD